MVGRCDLCGRGNWCRWRKRRTRGLDTRGEGGPLGWLPSSERSNALSKGDIGHVSSCGDMMPKACLMMRQGSSARAADSIARWNGQDMTRSPATAGGLDIHISMLCGGRFSVCMIKFRGYLGAIVQILALSTGEGWSSIAPYPDNPGDPRWRSR